MINFKMRFRKKLGPDEAERLLQVMPAGRNHLIKKVSGEEKICLHIHNRHSFEN